MDKALEPFQNLKIPLEEIKLATGDFDKKHKIGVGGYGNVYKGVVSHSKGQGMVAIKRNEDSNDQGDVEFLKEISALSRYEHENLISLLGFCYQEKEAILVYQLASRESLDKHLGSLELTWKLRLKICLGAAKGLRHIHDPLGTHQRLIHCDVKSANILLDDQWNAMVADFGFSTMGPANELQSTVINVAAGTPGYCDPQYARTNTLTKESDVYSFGVVLVEVLCGALCYTYVVDSVKYNLVPKWIKSYEEKQLDEIIFKDPTIEQMDRHALKTLSDIAYQCLKESRADRPKMAEVVTELETALRHQEEFLRQFQQYKIQLQEILLATNNFHKDYCIEVGGFGKVYKGELSHYKGRSNVAIKRLGRWYGLRESEFLNEITTLSHYRHENLISLLGYCNQGEEMILVYEFASHGSLGRLLNFPQLTWIRRLKICLDAAKALSYYHDPREPHQRFIHGYVNSSNILLDEHWNAKLSDFGLSMMDHTYMRRPHFIANGVATRPGYYDQELQMQNSSLSKDLDVYCFGVVLCEVLCARLCHIRGDGHLQQIFVSTWKKCYEEKKLNDIIFSSPGIQPLEPSTLEIFSDIVYRCLMESREDRPTMTEVVTELESALESEEFREWEPLGHYEEMVKTAQPSLNFKSKVELRKHLLKGVLLNGGKTWLSLNKKDEHCEMISFAECLDSVQSKFENNSRFPIGTYRSENGIFKTRVKAQFLSPGITYTVNLVFKMGLKKGRKCCDLISLKYKLQGDTRTSISYLAVKRQDGWWMAELYQFTSDQCYVDIEILFGGFDQYSYAFIEAEGIEFRPLEKVKHKDEKKSISDSNAESEEKLSTEYEERMTKEAYSIGNGGKWFSLDKNGKKCLMLSAREACIEGRMYTHLLSLPESRYGEALEFSLWRLVTSSTIQSHLVSPQTTYASYLVYKLPKDQSGFEAPVKVKDLVSDHIWYIYLVSPQTPVFRTNAKQNAYNPLSSLKIEGLPQQRNDGWMEIQIWEFRTATTTETNHMRLKLSGCGDTIPGGLIVQGVEFRP